MEPTLAFREHHGHTQEDIKYSSQKILSVLGYKIDLSEKAELLKEKFQAYYLDTKSHNWLMSRFSEIKFGMIQFVLSMMGFSAKELTELQKKALEGGVRETEEQFAQNEYNAEMYMLLKTSKTSKTYFC